MSGRGGGSSYPGWAALGHRLGAHSPDGGAWGLASLAQGGPSPDSFRADGWTDRQCAGHVLRAQGGAGFGLLKKHHNEQAGFLASGAHRAAGQPSLEAERDRRAPWTPGPPSGWPSGDVRLLCRRWALRAHRELRREHRLKGQAGAVNSWPLRVLWGAHSLPEPQFPHP